MLNLIEHIREARRSLRRSPVFVAITVVTLALGLGVTAAMFALVDGILVEPLPYPRPHQLVQVGHVAPGLNLDDLGISPALFVRYRQKASTLEAIARYAPDTITVAWPDRPAEQLEAARVSWTLSAVLGVAPARGRFFVAGDERPGAPTVAVLLDGAWRRHFGGRRDVIGLSVAVDGRPVQVVGLMPAGFSFPQDGVAMLIVEQIEESGVSLGTFDSDAIARLAPGVDLDGAREELDYLLQDLASSFPQDNAAPILESAQIGTDLIAYRDAVVGSLEAALWVLLGGVGLILLIAVASVANLFLVRAELRQRELAVKVALGATRSSIFAGFLAEGLLLAGVSGLLGVAVAQVAVAVAPWLGPEEVPRLESASVDGSVLLFLLALVLACAVLLAVVPLASQLSPRLLLALREGGRGGTDAYGTIRLRRLLVGAQVALALVLLVGAGLAARSLIELGGVDLGIQGEGVVVFRVSVPAAAYATREEVKDFHRRAVEQLATLPGVLQAAAVNDFPLTGSRRRRAFELEDFPLEAGEPPLMFGVKAVKGSFFEALGIPLIEGRLFDASDAARGARNVLISDVIAERFFSERSPVGRRFVEDDEASGESLYFTIVGVVGSVREDGPGAPPSEAVYYPLPAIDMGEMDLSTLYYLLRTQGDPESLIEAARAEVAQLDRAVPISGVTTVAGLVRRAGARYRFSALLLGGSAALALGFAALGLYGVVCFLVTQRRREIGVRVALGASTGEIQGLVLREGTLLAIAGIGAGCLGAMVAARWLRALLFEISPFDPAVFLMVSVVLLVVCQAACVIPARRAARLEPIAALRED